MDKNKLKGLKITCVGQSLSDGTGLAGAARLKNMINIFNDLGMDIDLISFSFFSEKFKIEKRVDCNVNITLIHIPNRLPKILKALAIFPVFYYVFKSSKNSDVIFTDFITEVAYIPSIIISKLIRKPVIIDYIDTNFFKVTNFLRNRVAKKADTVYAISFYLKNHAENKYKCKNVIYLPNFIDINNFQFNNEMRIKMRKKLGLEKDDIVLGYTGSFGYYEGVQILLQAFKNLKMKYPKLKLAIMGKAYFNGDENLSKICEDDPSLRKDVFLIPPQTHEKVPEFLTAFDILCCSKIDCEINRVANPVKVVEYLSMGLPTVCSAVGGIIDTIVNDFNGFLVSPGDVKSLENKIEYIILNKEKAKKISKKGREQVVKKFSYNAAEQIVSQSILKLIN